MSTSKEQVKKIAHLARIKISDTDLDKLSVEFNDIMKFVEVLEKAKTENIEPLYSVCNYELPKRPDKVTDGNLRDQTLKNAPETDSKKQFFTVPKVVE